MRVLREKYLSNIALFIVEQKKQRKKAKIDRNGALKNTSRNSDKIKVSVDYSVKC
jgi:hypothetical protein